VKAIPLAEDIKNIIEDTLSSYEARIESMGSIFDASPLIFSGFQESILDTKEEREKVNSQLRDVLAKKEHLRRKDFDNMMQGILSVQDEREREARNLLKDYLNAQKTMAQVLRENLRKFKDSLAKGETERVKEFQTLIKDILIRQEKRKEDITGKLKDFQKEQHNLAIRLKELLAKGNELRIKDFKLMLKEFKLQREERLTLQKKRKKEIIKMLTDFRKERQKVSPKAITIDAQNEQI
jgi:hypothetical protein